MRVHCRPRKDMFVPTGTKYGPLISDLEGTRVTDVHVVHTGEHTEIRDRWTDGTRSSRSLNKRWTGSTIFQTKVPEGSPPRVCLIADVLGEDEQNCRQETKDIIRLVRGGNKAVEGIETQVISKRQKR